MKIPLSRLSQTLVLVACLQVSMIAEKAWPRKVVEARLSEVKTASLPKGLGDALLAVDDITMGADALPDLLDVGRIDLNGDRVNEFIVHSAASYSAGPHLLLFQQLKGKFVQIANLWGGVYFGPRVNGYFQIVGQSRGGAGVYVRQRGLPGRCGRRAALCQRAQRIKRIRAGEGPVIGPDLPRAPSCPSRLV